MPWWLQIISIVGAASGTIATVVLGIQKARHEHAAKQTDDERADRKDLVAWVISDRDYWRTRCEAAEAKVDALEAELREVLRNADHVTDVAQAALLAFRKGTAVNDS